VSVEARGSATQQERCASGYTLEASIESGDVRGNHRERLKGDMMRVLAVALGIRIHYHYGHGGMTPTLKGYPVAGVAFEMASHCVGQVRGVRNHEFSLSGEANWPRVEFA
jgi:hypothetical protein